MSSTKINSRSTVYKSFMIILFMSNDFILFSFIILFIFHKQIKLIANIYRYKDIGIKKANFKVENLFRKKFHAFKYL